MTFPPIQGEFRFFSKSAQSSKHFCCDLPSTGIIPVPVDEQHRGIHPANIH